MKLRFASLLVITLAGASLRLLPHPPNFTPLAAIALFGGALFPTRASAFIVPLGTMLLSDVVLAITTYGWGGLGVMPFVYTSFALTVCLGRCIRRPRPLSVAGASLGSAVLFYLITNLGVWLSGQMYPATLQGLADCYAAAVPFFRNTVAGDVFYASLLFGGFELMQRRFPVLRAPSVALAEVRMAAHHM